MYRYLIVKFPVGNNDELSVHFILIVNERLVVSIGRKKFFAKTERCYSPQNYFCI